ncbi:hypothetical protein [Sphingobium estronivorans]|uniref:hypothetical protein n=1 Tax=Sphingobium estronivorans TaxID=1577690 RepID=UPI0013C342A9|nr:hypothetical protein [Sphingobium estronivorans]
MAISTPTYPALLANIGAKEKPNRAALRVLARRIRQEVYPRIEEPAERRRQVRRAIIAMLRY